MKTNLEFCECYNYPPEVKLHFKMMLDVINRDKSASVILIGGTSRGELSYRRVEKELTIFSDYEFLIVTEGRVSKAYRKTLRNYYDEVQKEIGGHSPLFHIDFACISLRKLRNLKKTFWTYEAKKTGITIWGKECTGQIPDVNLANINLKELNEALIWRLWTIFLYTPAELLTQGSIPSEKEEVFKYVLSKNVLDITTWLLPWEGYLIPSFTKRVAFVKERYQELHCGPFFGEGFPDFLGSCLEGKLKLRFGALTVLEFYAQSIGFFVNALQYLIYRMCSSQVRPEILPGIIRNDSSKLFRDNTFKRRAYDIVLAGRHTLNLRGKVLNWYLTKKHGATLVTLLYLHRATLQHLKGNKGGAKNLLSEAKESLRGISFVSVGNADDFLNEYLEIRKALVHFMVQYFPWIKAQYEHIRSIESGFYTTGSSGNASSDNFC